MIVDAIKPVLKPSFNCNLSFAWLLRVITPNLDVSQC